MYISDKYVYLLATLPLLIIWLIIFIKRKDLKQEILYISILGGVASVLTSYFWWTKDWWRPMTITGTVVGIEDFITGFAAGGIMAAIYSVVFDKVYGKKCPVSKPISGFLILFLLLFLTGFLFWSLGYTSFWSVTISLFVSILSIIFIRKDLFFNSLFSGVAMMLISVLSYALIIFLSDTWINNTYLDGLSGLRIATVPIEEFVFWFLAGMWAGPFYELVKGKC